MFGEMEDVSHEIACRDIRHRAEASRADRMLSEIATLKLELARERSRIDFLELTGTSQVYSISGAWFRRNGAGLKPVREPSLRAAIDASHDNATQ